MIELLIAAMLMQSEPAACHAVPRPAALPAGCAQWRPVGRLADSALFVDPASLRRDGAAFEIALRILYDEPQEEEAMRSGVTIARFDCAARTRALRRIASYDGGGTLIEARAVTGDEADPEPLPSGSPFAGLLTEYCPR